MAAAEELPFADDAFDGAVTRLVLQHVPEPEAVARELARVVRPGGLVVAIDVDGGLWGLSQPYLPELAEVQAKAWSASRERGGDRMIGRRLHRILAGAGLAEVALRPYAYHSDALGLDAFAPLLAPEALAPALEAGTITLADYQQLVRGYARFRADPDAFVLLVGLLASGRVPSPDPMTFDLDPLETHLLDRLRALPAGAVGGADEAEPLWRAQVSSRLCDFAARYLQGQGRSFYTIGSAGHESNAAVALASRPTDPALLHYRSGGFYLARAAQAGRDGVPDVLYGVTAAREEPIAGGRHKVFGNHALAVIPQTSTIASHLPRAVGIAFALERAKRLGLEPGVAGRRGRRLQLRRRLPQPRDGAGRAEQRRAPRLPGPAAAAPLRVRGQRPRDQRPLAAGLGRDGAARAAAAPLRARPGRRPRARARDGARPRRLDPRRAPARDPPSAHRPLPEPCRRRHGDRVPHAAGDPGRLGPRSAARHRRVARGRGRADGRGARRRVPRRARARARRRRRGGPAAAARDGRGGDAAARARAPRGRRSPAPGRRRSR